MKKIFHAHKFPLPLKVALILLVWQSFNLLSLFNHVPHSVLLTTRRKKPVENIVGKGENAGDHNVFYYVQNKELKFLNSVLSIWMGIVLKFCHLVKS